MNSASDNHSTRNMPQHFKFIWSDGGISNDMVCVRCTMEALEIIDKHLERSTREVVKVNIQASVGSSEQAPYISNVCGKIQHSSKNIVREEIAHMQHLTDNGFGTFKCFYSPLCNLTIVNSGILTLFRGARQSEDVETVIDHVLDRSTITEQTIHMIVASARLPYSISTQDYHLQRAILNDSRWSANIISSISDNWQTVRSYRLESFNEQFLQSLGIESTYCKEVLINITCKGSVNMFMSMHNNARFYVGVEKKVMFVFEFLFTIIRENS